ncbi:MAG: hypothetical protein A3D16_22260 [Rhodobacterales bacterium RIFCSPHIGHO2_02_FULL_62_130]|nr:MAG: hypothetical protein A3D16_22260 [Rhodobacterales bacterium RIFCSPHIGHO2_02_FULL_62_130]OHC54142.1 MAG: hypothetical protein A3E48_19890 [Rhodobacterales bacterium RIFCSPHIGHO2_12_FULL_62_75]HCY99672.1 TetR/AcrR family transcriptional regulator [Rhodobacter sp.]
MTSDPISTTREDWLAAALQILIEEGASAVKVLTLAQRLGGSRSSFYWFFKDRDALLAALLEYWSARNTKAITDRASKPAASVSQAVLHVFECWADPALFDAKLDFAVREWARRAPDIREAVHRADAERLSALSAMFARFCPDPKEAIVRARTLYFMQIGYYALDVQETNAQRGALLEHYVEVFSGEQPSAPDLHWFMQIIDKAHPEGATQVG